MGRPLYTNNAATYLAFGITNTATTMQVSANAGGLFPNPTGGDYFYVSLISLSGPIIEIVKCTARSGDILTIERGQEGTSPLYWNTGDNVQLRITAAGMNFISGATATTTEEETQTATQGQTVFTLNTIDYTPNTNNLAVFVNGSKQVSGVNFTETSLNTVTFTSGLNAGDVVEFIYGLTIASGTLYATDIKYNEGGIGAVTRTLESKLQESISALDFGADPTGANDSTTAIQEAINAAATNSSTVLIPAGLYKVTNTLNLPPNVTLEGQGYPFPVGDYNPTARFTGTVINKQHSNDCIVVQGTSDNQECAGIKGIAIISNYNTYPAGDGIKIDRVSGYYIDNCNIWSCGGNGFTIGVSSGDVQGNNTIRNTYVNNCVGHAYHIRSKWFYGDNIKSDGCSVSLYMDASPESYITAFHFEGPSQGAVSLNNGNTYTSFIKGFISLTNSAATYGVQGSATPGEAGFTFDSVHIIGTGTATSSIGFTLTLSDWTTRITNCYLSEWGTAIQNAGEYNVFANNIFDTNALPISESGAYTKIIGNSFVGTTGSYDINHVSGQGNGSWTNNFFDKPLEPTAFGGSNGNFGQNIVVNNNGYKTQARGVTSAITSGTAVPHGLSITPYCVFVNANSPYSLPSDLKTAYDGTNITFTWTTGPSSIQLSWEAFGVCASTG
jgi:hypothetical protein